MGYRTGRTVDEEAEAVSMTEETDMQCRDRGQRMGEIQRMQVPRAKLLALLAGAGLSGCRVNIVLDKLEESGVALVWW